MVSHQDCRNFWKIQEFFTTKLLVRCTQSHSQDFLFVPSGILFNDVYAASKFAVEGFCESLAIQALKFKLQ